MPIHFSQVREDPNVELHILEKLGLHCNILTVGSGGCTLLSLMRYADKINTIHVIDCNVEQIYLIQLKVELICFLVSSFSLERPLLTFLNFIEGKLTKAEYDEIFKQIKSKLTPECRSYWKEHINDIYLGINQIGVYEKLFEEWRESGHNFQLHFSLENLKQKFGHNATTASSKNLEEPFVYHFQNIWNNYKFKYTPDNNYFYSQMKTGFYTYHLDKNNKILGDLPPYMTMECFEKIQKYKHKIIYHRRDLCEFIEENKSNKFSLINLSNVTDWLSPDKSQLDDLFQNIRLSMTPNGFLVARRLSGNYQLKEVLKANGYYTRPISSLPEKSQFYKETVVASLTSSYYCQLI